MLLSGCASVKAQGPKLSMTSQMFVCQEKPLVPHTDSDAELATYIIRLVLAHDDCTAQLDTVQNHLEINGVEVSDQMKPTITPKSKFLGLF